MNSGLKNGINAFQKGIFAGAFLLQAVTAILWAIGNIAAVPGFLETRDGIAKISGFREGFLGIGYRGILHLLSADGGLTMPGRIILYVLQFLICFSLLYLAVAAFYRGLSGEKAEGIKALVAAGFIVTNPFYFPMIFSAVPDALATAVLLYTAASAFLWIRKRREEKNTVFLLPVCAGIVMLFLLSGIAFVCGCVLASVILLTGCVLNAISKEKEGKTKAVLLPVLFAVVILLFCGAAVAGGHYTAGKKFTPEEKSKLVEEYGEPYYITLRSGNMAKKFLKEWFSEAAAPGILLPETYPLGNSLDTYNENVLWQKMPRLTHFYFKAGRISYPIGLLCLFAGWLLALSGKEEKNGKRDLKNLLFFCGILLLATLCYSFRATPEFDYRSALFAYLFWGVFAAGMSFRNTNRTLMFLGKDTKWEKQP